MLPDFPVVVPLEVAWGDMDSFGHVNNVVYFAYFERVRIELLRRAGWFDQKDRLGIGPIIASTAAKFRKPLSYPDALLLGCRVAQIDGDRVTVEHAVWSGQWQVIAADGPAVVVNFDYANGRKSPLAEPLLAILRSLMGSSS
jgi:acyl-CoA thioester hydrolase